MSYCKLPAVYAANRVECSRQFILVEVKSLQREFMAQMICLRGRIAWPDTFTDDFCRIVRLKNEILLRVYETHQVSRDSEYLSGAVTESFLERFAGGSDESMMTP